MLPLTDETLKDLKAGDNVLLTGIMYVGRDAAHKRIVETLDKGCIGISFFITLPRPPPARMTIAHT